jgi:hypothetical protein
MGDKTLFWYGFKNGEEQAPLPAMGGEACSPGDSTVLPTRFNK